MTQISTHTINQASQLPFHRATNRLVNPKASAAGGAPLPASQSLPSTPVAKAGGTAFRVLELLDAYCLLI